MFENLTEKLQRVFKNLRGQGKLTEEHLDAALGGIREALLDGDVNVDVADELLAHIRAKALGSEVLLQLSPDQQVLKIVRDELLELLGKQAKPALRLAPAVGLADRRPARLRQNHHHRQARANGSPATAIARWSFRPTSIAPPPANSSRKWPRPSASACWPGAGTDKPLEIARGAIREAKLSASDVILVDTAGRLHIDDDLMTELGHLKRELQPAEILFIADAMIGQDAVRSAGEFHRRLGLTGVILTKLDGDARGGAALSIGKVTGAPVKFVGVGEKYDALEAFYPERIVSRVLGMGDMLTLIERAEQTIDHKKAAELERKLRRSEFTLEDFRDQLRQVRKMGPLEQVLGMLPKVGPFANLPKDATVDESRLKHIEAIINSMTAAERDDHDLIDGKRRKRIARGSGTSVQEVNQVLKQYLQMRKMMKQYGALAAQGRLRGLGKAQRRAPAEQQGEARRTNEPAKE